MDYMDYFDSEKTTKEVIAWIQQWFKNNGNDSTKAVIGISGGKDSTIVAGLLAAALGKDRVIGVMMPNGTQTDIADSIRVCESLGIKSYTVNIKSAYDNLTDAIKTAMGTNPEVISKMYTTNTPARLRMTTLYGVAAEISNCRIANTCNLSEDICGYSTYGGDSFNDFAPINHLTTDEVIAIGDYLGLPYDLVHKAPSDGMCGFTDEDNLGFTYREVNELVRFDKHGPNYDKIMNKFNWNKFKLQNIRLPFYDPKLPMFLHW